MKELPSDKYNVAWFKLAEFVARGEKERALALYRLLAHSFDNKALAYQLEGDLLLSFNDDTARVRYVAAAQHYLKENRLIESATVYEHLLALDPDKSDYYLQTIILYKKLDYSSSFIRNFLLLVDLYIRQGHFEKIADVLYAYEYMMTQEEKSKIYSSVTLELVKKNAEYDLLQSMIQKTIEYLLLDSGNVLQLFIAQLQAINEPLYKKALTYI